MCRPSNKPHLFSEQHTQAALQGHIPIQCTHCFQLHFSSSLSISWVYIASYRAFRTLHSLGEKWMQWSHFNAKRRWIPLSSLPLFASLLFFGAKQQGNEREYVIKNEKAASVSMHRWTSRGCCEQLETEGLELNSTEAHSLMTAEDWSNVCNHLQSSFINPWVIMRLNTTLLKHALGAVIIFPRLN